MASCRPGSAWDWALLGLAICASIPFAFANFLVWWHRHRKYFRAQGGAALILASSTCGLLWIASNFVVNLHFPRRGRLLQICPLWSFWLQLTFGFWLWLACLIIRLYRLFVFCTTNAPANRLRIWNLDVFLLWSPALIFAVLATSKHVSNWNGTGDCANCQLIPAWKWSTFLILPSIYFPILVLLLFRLKGEKDYMLAIQYRHTSEYSIMAFVIFLLYAIVYATKIEREVYGRCFLTFCVCCLVFLHFWVPMAWPVYLCFFKRESEMDNFEDELRLFGARCFDKMGSVVERPTAEGSMTSFPPFQPHRDGDWILRAIDAAVAEASVCKERITQLELKKTRLFNKIKDRELLAAAIRGSSAGIPQTVQVAQFSSFSS